MRPHVILLQQNQSLMMGAKEHVEQKALKSLVLIVIRNIQMRIMVHIEVTILRCCQHGD